MNKVSRILGATLVAMALCAAVLLAWAWRVTDAAMARRYAAPRELGLAQAVRAAPLDLGRRIVTVRNGCVDCHGADLSGRKVVDNAFIGTLHGPNITPARLRDWRDDEIARAIRYGVSRDGRPLVLMPSHEYQYLAREDLAAVVAYLRHVPAVDAVTPPPSVGPGARVMFALGKLPTLLPATLIDPSRGFDDKPIEAATAQFGRYLAASACAGCHGAEFRGGRIPGGPPDWAPASSLRLGSDERWSEAGFMQAMRTGRSAVDGHPLQAPMPVQMVAQMSDVELGALWRYFATLR